MPTIHIVSHTHWDREWYKSFQYFRSKLLYVMDDLLDILEKDPTFESFLLDGQTIVLDDYLQLRPEKEPILKEMITAGRLVVGPWYIQPDEFAPDGESLIRNLQTGIRQAQRFGRSMMIGYLPDSFGQSGQLPHILQGFGIQSAVMMRGFPANEVKSSEFNWQGINGDEILGLFLPKGYSNFMCWPESLTMAKMRMVDTVRKLKKFASTDQFLIMNGVDHQFAQAHIPKHIRKMNHGRVEYRHSSIQDYIDAVKAQNPALPTLQGDLLAPITNRVHSSMASTRMPQKQRNRKMEALLEKYVEPVCTMGWLFNASYPDVLIRQAWKLLMQNQTHDGICGCCTDEVHKEIDQRYTDIKTIGETLLKTYSRAIARQQNDKSISLTVFNSAFSKGRQIVQATLFSKHKDFRLLDKQGRDIPYQVDFVEPLDLAEASMWVLYLGIPEPGYRIDFTFEHEFDFNAGYEVLDIQEGKKPKFSKNNTQENTLSFENKFYRLNIECDGSLSLLDKASDHSYRNLLTFEDVGDAGDTYNFSPVTEDTVVNTRGCKAEISVLSSGTIKTTFRIKLEIQVPEKLVDSDQRRSAQCTTLPVISEITCYKNHARIDVKTTVNNTALDHRLRVLFPAGICTDHSIAETQFGRIQRPLVLNTENWQKEKWSERPLPIYAMQKFVAVQNEQRGLAVLNRGLTEYEIYQPEEAVIAITLLRGVGMMGKGDLAIRPGRASGIPVPTPDAQCPGEHTFEYAIYPFCGDMDQAAIPLEAARYETQACVTQSIYKLEEVCKKFKPMLGFVDYKTLITHIRKQIQVPSGTKYGMLNISDDALLISALKKAEEEQALILRLYNSSAAAIQDAVVHTAFAAEQCYQCNFLEENQQPIAKLEEGNWQIPQVRPFSAITLKFTLPNKNL